MGCPACEEADLKYPAPPSYEQEFPFPTISKYSSESAPRFPKVVLVPYKGPDPEFEWTVLAGFQRVAEVLVESEVAHNISLVETKVATWINSGKASITEDHDWRRGWADQLARNPVLANALARGPEELFDRAGLTVPQRIAMRLRMRDDRSGREIALELGISESAFRERIALGAAAILKVGSCEQSDLKTSA